MESENKKGVEAKKLVRPGILVFLVSFLLINWQEIAWVFNYRVVSNLARAVLTEPSRPVLTNSIQDGFSLPIRLEIPKLGLSVPLVPGRSLDLGELEEDLDRGVVLYPGSSLPDQDGQTIILGHSAPPGWPKINYDWVFSEINHLEKNDEVVIQLGSKKYVYRVNQTTILNQGDEIPNSNPRVNNLILVSCWPPGKNYKRIAVEAISTN